MKTKAFALIGATGVALLGSSAMAAITGVSIEAFVGDGWTDNGYDTGALSTYRLYANFDGMDDDGVLSAFGISGVPASANSWDGSFHNDPLGGLTAPLDLRGAGLWSNQWDTYVTIGKDTQAGDATSLSPGFETETNGLASNWVSENVGWFVTPDDPQSIAVERVDQNGDTVYSVFLAQFTVANSGDGNDADVYGTISVLARDGIEYQSYGYSTATPAPGVLALLGLAGLAGRRRR